MTTYSAAQNLQRLQIWAFLSNRKEFIIERMRAQYANSPYPGAKERSEEIIVVFLDQLRHRRLTNKIIALMLDYVDFDCAVCGAPKAEYRCGLKGFCRKHLEEGKKVRVSLCIGEGRGKQWDERVGAKDQYDRERLSRKGTIKGSRNRGR